MKDRLKEKMAKVIDLCESVVSVAITKWSPGQPRDEQGRFGSGGGVNLAPDAGGSFGGGGGESATALMTEVVTGTKSPLTKSDAKQWGGDRGHIASDAVKEITGGGLEKNGAAIVARGSDGKVSAIVTLDNVNSAGSIYIKNPATKEKGFGEKMMARVCQLASQKNKGLMLRSLPGAESFYAKMGMKKMPEKGGTLPYRFTRDEARAFYEARKHLLKRKKTDSLEEAEPENGAFCKPFLGNPPFEEYEDDVAA